MWRICKFFEIQNTFVLNCSGAHSRATWRFHNFKNTLCVCLFRFFAIQSFQFQRVFNEDAQDKKISYTHTFSKGSTSEKHYGKKTYT